MNRFCSIFSQLLQLFPRWEFQQLVVATKAERHARGFSSWGQFVAMLFCQLGRAHSLREICGGLATCEGKLHHLGIVSPKRSTLSYANEHRPWQLYEKVFYRLLDRCLRETEGRRKRRFRFKNPLLSLVGWAKGRGLERGQKIRVDATAVKSDIGHPLDSHLLYDSIRTQTALAERHTILYSDHCRRAKRRVTNIRNSRGLVTSLSGIPSTVPAGCHPPASSLFCLFLSSVWSR